MQLKESIKYLTGSIVIYMLVAACSEETGSPLQAILDAGRDVVIRSLDGRILDAPNPRDVSTLDGTVFDASKHRDGSMTSPVRDAKAQDASNAACGCSDPSTRAANALGGYISNTGTPLEGGIGPLFVSDVAVGKTSTGAGARFFTVDTASSCGATGATTTVLSVPPETFLSGARYFVPQGKKLCVLPQSYEVFMSWAGFRVPG